MRAERIDFIGLVETLKPSFSPSELSAIAGIDRFRWNFVASVGQSGGFLLGTNNVTFDFVAFDHGIYWASMVVSLRSNNTLLELMVVYGPADHSLSQIFLDEIFTKIDACQLPLLIGGDFNLLRYPSDKSSVNFSWVRAEAFNAFIRDTAIREIPRVGARYTWTNRQTCPIRSVLDRVFICPAWDGLFPRCSLRALPIVGSDHAPLILDDGLCPNGCQRFQFDASWLLVEGFPDMLAQKILGFLTSPHRSFGPMDDWHYVSYSLRKFLRGWAKNHFAESRRDKSRLSAQISALDSRADNGGLSATEWQVHYGLEKELLAIHRQEEVYWKQRGTINWTLKGDSPTAYFFAIANGRRRRCLINSLIIDGVRVSEPPVILRHVVRFFSNLLSAKPDLGFALAPGFWAPLDRISHADNELLLIPPSEEEIFDTIRTANSNAASGPDGFSIPFFRQFWPQLKGLISAVIQGYWLGSVDISRLNYAVLSLIPKVKGADMISQFRPIALINNFAKMPAKGMATRLSPIAHRTISPFQSAFIKGRFILDGVLCLHEIVHDLRVRGTKAVVLKLDFEKAYDSVSWKFLRQVLLAKGFEGPVMQRLMELVSGGHTAVAVNGQISQFFANGRGLRQGDPASPLLFNFVADALSRILSRAALAGHITPVSSHLIPNGISHLQYADDTIILMELNDNSLTNLKFLLLCFEALSGLKINFSKSEVVVTGVSDEEAQRVAHLLNCSLGSYPLKYLGLPISPLKLLAKDFAPVVTKVGNRVLPWRGRYNTQAGKVALTNSCLSSLPMFLMGFYLLSSGVHNGFDKHRGAFYWNAADNKRKYRMVRWDIICRPKAKGGLGIINTRVMNNCLMIKWWWKIMTLEELPPWLSILKAKYFPSSSPMFAPAAGGSQFWHQLVKVRPIFRSLVKFVVRNGKSTRFWLDWWVGDSTLVVAFPVLFSYCDDTEVSIFELSARGWVLDFRRSLSPEELEDWQRLTACFPLLSEEEDAVVWPLSSSGRFSVKSAYSKLIPGGRPVKFKHVWSARIPPKIKIFLWQAVRSKLPAADQIKKRNGPGSDRCVLCGALENTEHIFFHCSLAKLMWSCIRLWLHVNWSPSSFEDLRHYVNLLSGHSKRVFLVGWAAIGWSLWTTRNKFSIEHIFPANPVNCLFKANGFLQQWRLLTKEGDLQAFDAMLSKMKSTASGLLRLSLRTAS